MTPNIKPLIAGNWKMNGMIESLGVIGDVVEGLSLEVLSHKDVLICPPFTLVQAAAIITSDHSVMIGAQDCHVHKSGAHTGDISADMIADCGADAVIVGHSERRADHGESDALIRSKAEAVNAAGLLAIICVGETEAERRAGKAIEIVSGQLAGSVPDTAKAAHIVIAYEPVWAIGTGLTPTVDDVAEIHAAIRKDLISRFGDEGAKMRILYGGSVKPSNAAELMAVANVDGALVGGASLKAADFLGIITA